MIDLVRVLWDVIFQDLGLLLEKQAKIEAEISCLRSNRDQDSEGIRVRLMWLPHSS